MAFRLRPLHEDTLQFAGLSNTQILILALEASQKLEWNIDSPEMEPLMSRLKKMADKFEASTNAVKEAQDQELLDFTARRLMEMAADIIMSHLLIQDASRSSELFSKSAHVYLNYAEAEVEKHANFISNFDKEDLAFYKK